MVRSNLHRLIKGGMLRCITVAHVLRENVLGSEIEWPVVRHSRGKKRDVLKGRYLAHCGWPEGSSSYPSMSMSK